MMPEYVPSLAATIPSEKPDAMTVLARPMLFVDNYRAKKGTPCTVVKLLKPVGILPPLYEVRFLDGTLQYVHKEDLEEVTE